MMPNTFVAGAALPADPVTGDIDFSISGQMAVGTFSSGLTHSPTYDGSLGIADKSYYAKGDTDSMYNHTGRTYVFDLVGETWTKTAQTSVGQNGFGSASPNGTSTGGVAWHQDPSRAEILWISGGDFNGEDSNWGVIGYDSGQFGNVDVQESATSYIQFIFPNQFDAGEVADDEKGNGGC